MGSTKQVGALLKIGSSDTHEDLLVCASEEYRSILHVLEGDWNYEVQFNVGRLEVKELRKFCMGRKRFPQP